MSSLRNNYVSCRLRLMCKRTDAQTMVYHAVQYINKWYFVSPEKTKYTALILFDFAEAQQRCRIFQNGWWHSIFSGIALTRMKLGFTLILLPIFLTNYRFTEVICQYLLLLLISHQMHIYVLMYLWTYV